MSERRKPLLDSDFLEAIRERIEVVKVIDKLQGHIDDPQKHPMLATQIKAADILLKKRIPDLKAIEHSGTIETTAAQAWQEALKRAD